MTPAPALPMPPPLDPGEVAALIRSILHDPARRFAFLRARARALVAEAEKETVK